MRREKESDLYPTMFLTGVGESFNDAEETLMRNEASLTLNVLDHNKKKRKKATALHTLVGGDVE